MVYQITRDNNGTPRSQALTELDHVYECPHCQSKFTVRDKGVNGPENLALYAQHVQDCGRQKEERATRSRLAAAVGEIRACDDAKEAHQMTVGAYRGRNLRNAKRTATMADRRDR
jgi:hypothetical protein